MAYDYVCVSCGCGIKEKDLRRGGPSSDDGYACPRCSVGIEQKIKGKVGPIRELVSGFAAALERKLLAAEEKYGWNNGWRDSGWMNECRQELVRHLAKGDPLDVAAYCAFLWHHKATTTGVVDAVSAAAIELAFLTYQLRASEGASVTLFSENAEGTGPNNNAITVCDDWTDWQERSFAGETLNAALKAAFAAKVAKVTGG